MKAWRVLHSLEISTIVFVLLSFPLSPRYSPVNVLSTLPDLNLAYIERLPRYDYLAAKNQPTAGDAVNFVAHIANRGGQPTGEFIYRWYMDDLLVQSANHASLQPGEMTTVSMDWNWATGPHYVRVELDPDQLISEVSEDNNQVEDQTNALAVGFWVEQSVYDWFNLHQIELGIGSVSWEDWAQRQLSIWNQFFKSAVHPLTPRGIVERVRLDKVTIIPDGTWGDCANGPDPEDREVDLVWGFVAEQVGVDKGRVCPSFNFYIDNPQLRYYEPSLIHELSHARYLVDLYGMSVNVNDGVLAQATDSTASTFVLTQNVENNGNYPLPAYLAIDGELVICQSKVGNSFTECTRGAEGTTPRAHAENTFVTLALVRVQDGKGNLVQGSQDMPIIGGWHDFVYITRYNDTIMGGGGSGYGQHSAYAFNRIAGQRPVCGNANAPCNIGEYLNEVPMHNILEILDEYGKPISGARIEVFQSKPVQIWYGHLFLKSPDLTFTTNSQGRANLGQFPFGTPIIHTYGFSNALLLLKVTANGKSLYRFMEITQANEAYWSGHQDTAVYVLKMSLNIDKKGPVVAEAGNPITYTLTINNPPTSLPATNLLITDTIPTGASYLNGGERSGDVVSWTIPSLDAGASTSVEFSVAATQTITNSIYGVRADGDIAATGVSPVVTLIGPHLSITKSGPPVASTGEPITYNLTVTNDGVSTATNLLITDRIPEGATYLDGGTRSGDIVNWNIPTLKPGASIEVQFSVTATDTIINSDYSVQGDDGINAQGAVAVTTQIVSNKEIYLPILIR